MSTHSTFASSVAYPSHTGGSISPSLSTSFTPLSSSGLCEAVIITPIVAETPNNLYMVIFILYIQVMIKHIVLTTYQVSFNCFLLVFVVNCVSSSYPTLSGSQYLASIMRSKMSAHSAIFRSLDQSLMVDPLS